MVYSGHIGKGASPHCSGGSHMGPRWSGGHVCFHCDNEAVVAVIQNRNAHQDLLVQLLRCLFFYASPVPVSLFSSAYTGGAQRRCGRNLAQQS